MPGKAPCPLPALCGSHLLEYQETHLTCEVSLLSSESIVLTHLPDEMPSCDLQSFLTDGNMLLLHSNGRE